MRPLPTWRLALYKGNYLSKNDKPLDDKATPSITFMGLVNQLVDRVFTDVYLTVGVPNAALGAIGDWAINTSTWIPYEKTAATTWTARTAIDNNANAFLLISSKR
jgi:hypothetical protein